MKLTFIEDQCYREFLPAANNRPVFGLRCGCFTLEERMLKLLGSELDKVYYVMRPQLEADWNTQRFHSEKIRALFTLPEEGNVLLVNGRALLSASSIREMREKAARRKPYIWRDGEQWVSVYLPDHPVPFTENELRGGSFDLGNLPLPSLSFKSPLIVNSWPELVNNHSRMIREDFGFISKRLRRLPVPPLPDNVAVLNRRNLVIGKFVEIDPFVTIDCREGPVIIGDHVRIEPGVLIKGPMFIEDNRLIKANSVLHERSSSEVSREILPISGYVDNPSNSTG